MDRPVGARLLRRGYTVQRPHFAGGVSRFVAYVVDLGASTGVFMLARADPGVPAELPALRARFHRHFSATKSPGSARSDRRDSGGLRMACPHGPAQVPRARSPARAGVTRRVGGVSPTRGDAFR